MQDKKQSIALTMGGILAVDLGTGKLLGLEKVKALREFGRKARVMPSLGHVAMLNGKPIITLDGYIFRANGTGKYYQLMGRPFTDEERSDRMTDGTDKAWRAEVVLDGGKKRIVGFGVATAEEMTESKGKRLSERRIPVIAETAWQLAQRRAEWQAMKRAFPLGVEEPEPEEKVDAESTAEESKEVEP